MVPLETQKTLKDESPTKQDLLILEVGLYEYEVSCQDRQVIRSTLMPLIGQSILSSSWVVLHILTGQPAPATGTSPAAKLYCKKIQMAQIT